MSNSRVKSSRDEYNVRVKTVANRQDYSSKRRQVLSISHRLGQPARPGNIDVVAQARPIATFYGAARARVKIPMVMTMQWNVENVGVVVERVLGAVSMVNGPVDD